VRNIEKDAVYSPSGRHWKMQKYPYGQAARITLCNTTREIKADDVYRILAGREIYLGLDLGGRLQLHCRAGDKTEKYMRGIRLWLRSPILEALILLNLEVFADRHHSARRLWKAAMDFYLERQAILYTEGIDATIFECAVMTARNGPEPQDIIFGEKEKLPA